MKLYMRGLGIGDWGLQSPIPNPQSPINHLILLLVIDFINQQYNLIELFIIKFS